jgi:hypothetical protein
MKTKHKKKKNREKMKEKTKSHKTKVTIPFNSKKLQKKMYVRMEGEL